MSMEHIPFRKLSDFLDDKIISAAERNSIQDHLDRCDICRKEYHDLRKTVRMLSCLKFGIVNGGEFVNKTVDQIKHMGLYRAKWYRGRVSISAIAASIILIVGIALFTDGFYNSKKDDEFMDIAGDKRVYEDYINYKKGRSSSLKSQQSRQVFSLMKMYNAKVRDISESYIEGEVNSSNYEYFKRELKTSGSRKVLLDRSGISQSGMISKDPDISAIGWTSYSDDEKVRFRIILK